MAKIPSVMPPLPPWTSDKARRKRQNRDSGRQERDRAKEVGGRAQPGSGSSWRAPEDVVNGDFLEQLRYTDADSFNIKVKHLKSLKANSLRMGLQGRTVVEFRKHNIRIIIEEG